MLFDHLEFITLDAYVNVRFVEVLPFLTGRDDHDLGFSTLTTNRHTNWMYPAGPTSNIDTNSIVGPD